MHGVPALSPAHLQRVTRVLSQARGKLRRDAARRRAVFAEFLVFLLLFGAVLALETGMAAMMFSLLEVEVMGHAVSGAAFGLLVPVVIGAAHVQKHHDHDLLTRLWMGRLASIGILLFVLGVSGMVGFSAWQAGQDAMTDFVSGPSGMLGAQSLQGQMALGATSGAMSGATSGVTSGATSGAMSGAALGNAYGDVQTAFGAVPNTLLFLGLSFGMIISVYFASFCLGRVLQGWALLCTPSLAGKAAIAKITQVQGHIKALHQMIAADTAARGVLPKDLKRRFAREAGQLCQGVAHIKLAAAARKFHPLHSDGPLAHASNDPEAEALPARFTSEEDFAHHIAAQLNTISAPHILRVLNAHSDQKDTI